MGKARTTSFPADQTTSIDVLRKPVNTLAIVPKSGRITSLGRKSYNVLLFEAQEQGLEKDVFRTPLERIMRGVDFDSNDHELIKKHLRAMVSTTVEWQSPTTGEGASWNVSGLLAHAKLTKERGQVWVEGSYSVNLKQELLEPTVFARLKLEVISQLRSHAAIALYEICMRYRDVGRTSRQPWRWWRPVLSGQPETERTAKLEYRIFKRDTLKPAIAEVCAITDLDIELVEHATFHAQIRKDLSPIVHYQAARFPVADVYLTQFFDSASIVNTPTAVTNFSHCNVADAEIRAARAATDKPVVVYPNSGERYDAGSFSWHGESSCDAFGDQARQWYAAGARAIGGCCRTTPDHIRAVAEWARAVDE